MLDDLLDVFGQDIEPLRTGDEQIDGIFEGRYE